MPDKAFGACEWDPAGVGGGFDVADEIKREEAAQVEEYGGLRVEELGLVVAHGVFVRAEGGEQVLEREAPNAVAVAPGAGQVEVVEGAEVVAVILLNERDDFLRDAVGRVAGGRGNGNLALVGVAVVGVEGELAAQRFGIPHEDTGLLSHAAVEAVHDIGSAVPVGTVGGEKVGGGAGPGGIRDEVEQKALRLCIDEVEAEFAFGRLHDGEAGELMLALELEESLSVRMRRPVVEDFDAAASLFEGEVAHVADEDNELFLVVRPAERFCCGLYDDDAGLVGGLLGEWAGAVGVAVVRYVDPAARLDFIGSREVRRDERGEVASDRR